MRMRLHLQLKSCLLYQNISFQTINDLMKLVHNTQFIIAFEIWSFQTIFLNILKNI